MKKLMLLSITLTLAGCTDATLGSLGSFNETAQIQCYSGGEIVFEDESTGKVEIIEGGGGWHYKSVNGHYVRTFADCIVSVKK